MALNLPRIVKNRHSCLTKYLFTRKRSTSFVSEASKNVAVHIPKIIETPQTLVTTLPSGFRVASENTNLPTATVL